MSMPVMVAPKLILEPSGGVRGWTTGPVAEGMVASVWGLKVLDLFCLVNPG